MAEEAKLTTPGLAPVDELWSAARSFARTRGRGRLADSEIISVPLETALKDHDFPSDGHRQRINASHVVVAMILSGWIYWVTDKDDYEKEFSLLGCNFHVRRLVRADPKKEQYLSFASVTVQGKVSFNSGDIMKKNKDGSDDDARGAECNSGTSGSENGEGKSSAQQLADHSGQISQTEEFRGASYIDSFTTEDGWEKLFNGMLDAETVSDKSLVDVDLDELGKTVFVVFCGTKVANTIDILTDLYAVPARSMSQPESKIQMHGGILNLLSRDLRQRRDELLGLFDDLEGGDDPDGTVIFTGHSLGGGLALMSTLLCIQESCWAPGTDCGSRLFRRDALDRIMCFAFGSPMIVSKHGNEEMAPQDQETLALFRKYAINFVNCNDIVPRLPARLKQYTKENTDAWESVQCVVRDRLSFFLPYLDFILKIPGMERLFTGIVNSGLQCLEERDLSALTSFHHGCGVILLSMEQAMACSEHALGLFDQTHEEATSGSAFADHQYDKYMDALLPTIRFRLPPELFTKRVVKIKKEIDDRNSQWTAGGFLMLGASVGLGTRKLNGAIAGGLLAVGMAYFFRETLSGHKIKERALWELPHMLCPEHNRSPRGHLEGVQDVFPERSAVVLACQRIHLPGWSENLHHYMLISVPGRYEVGEVVELGAGDERDSGKDNVSVLEWPSWTKTSAKVLRKSFKGLKERHKSRPGLGLPSPKQAYHDQFIRASPKHTVDSAMQWRICQVVGAAQYSHCLRNSEHICRYALSGSWSSIQMERNGGIWREFCGESSSSMKKAVEAMKKKGRNFPRELIPDYPLESLHKGFEDEAFLKLVNRRKNHLHFPQDNKSFNVAFVGPSGAGKSNLINELFNKRVCESRGGIRSVTQDFHIVEGCTTFSSDPRRWNIIDCIGFCDSLLSQAKSGQVDMVCELLKKYLREQECKLHKVVVVVDGSGRLEGQHIASCRIIMDWLDYHSKWEHFIFVFNKTNRLDQAVNIEEEIQFFATQLGIGSHKDEATRPMAYRSRIIPLGIDPHQQRPEQDGDPKLAFARRQALLEPLLNLLRQDTESSIQPGAVDVRASNPCSVM
uniref:Fungal lipase-like domain-containing protein n=1 Tax=Pinguiococcus pyrenoidosus TaxID=172671 RepID=A0A7R9YE70_9STRA|mmetsp:Transcript_6305/g.24557  ORF Transcript_6305/g.24557 Transcript_6305/m.24557 type:complete len:1075 (+) Transcript_6305:108-3332(+)|eukprot:scaffold700_cov158-Pinguiococcus_pyrenoidosus.AAC.4